jgi:enoyl-CoA hydratase
MLPRARCTLTAEAIDAREALWIGLINEVVAPDRLIPPAEEILKLINANAPLAVRFSIEAVNRGLDVGQAEGLVIERALFAICASSQDKREGTSAFLEKRTPQFSGR